MGPNTPPVANPDTAAVVESGVSPGNTPFAGSPSAAGNVLGNDSDPDAGDTKTVSAVNGQGANVGSVLAGLYGSVQINADGSYSYTLDNAKAATQALSQGQVANEVFNYTLKDTAGATSTSTLTVSVSGTNDAPVAVADTAFTPLNVPLASINVKGNDTDVDSAPASLVVSNPVLSNPAQGTVSVNPDGTLAFTPASGVSGPVAISYTLTDDKGASTTGSLSVTVGRSNPTVVITEDANNDGFISAAELFGSVGVKVSLPADAQVGDILSVTDGMTINTIVLSAAQIAAGNASTSFASPGEGNTIRVIATIADAAGNVGATSPAASAKVDTTAPSVLTGRLNPSAPDDSGTLGDSITSNPSPAITGTGNVGDTITLYAIDGVTVLGTALVDTTGAWSLDPVSNYLSEGLNTLSVRATDRAGNQGPAMPVAVTLDTTAPLAPTVVVAEDANNDGLISAVELFGLVDVRIGLPVDAKAGDALTVTDGTTTNTFVLTVAQITAGNVTTSFASPGQGNTISVTARITDVAGNEGAVSAPDRAVIDTRVPLAVQDVLVTRESTPLVIGFAILLQNDIGAAERPLVITSVQDALNGTVAIVDGKIVFTPNANYFGPASFSYTVSDGLGSTSTATVNVAVQTFDPLPVESERFVDSPNYIPPKPAVSTDPALHVLYSVNDVRVDTGLRAGLGIFQTDSVTLAELSSEQALALDNLTAPRGFDGLDESHLLGNGIGAQNALFVQHAVRHESLVSEVGLFVQNSVRASQLESLARNIRVDAFNSAISGVDTLLDPFALGSPVVSPVTPLAEALEKERQNAPTSQLEKENSLQANNVAQAAEPGRAPVAADDAPARQVKRRAADGFAAQLRRNATAFRTSALRPETPLSETTRMTR